MFDSRDAADIALQRTSALLRFPILGSPSYRLWAHGISGGLQLEAFLRRKRIIGHALSHLEKEYDELRSFLGARSITRLMDIGCGHGLINFFFVRDYGCTVHLVDIEQTDHHHHDFHDVGAGYGSLAKASTYLIANGAPASAIRTTNPRREPIVDCDVDLIISLLSAGFHYPINDYAKLALRILRPGGLLIADIRHKSGQEGALKGFSRKHLVHSTNKYARIALER